MREQGDRAGGGGGGRGVIFLNVVYQNGIFAH